MSDDAAGDNSAVVTFTGSAGFFTSGGSFPAATGGIACNPNLTTTSLTYTTGCINGIDGNATPDNYTTTVSFQCSSPGPVRFLISQGTPAQTAATPLTGQPGAIVCNDPSLSSSGGAGGIFLDATPNVVDCKGGSTTITAYSFFQPPRVPTPVGGSNGSPQPQQPHYFFKTDKGLLQQTSNNTAVLTLLKGMTETATVIAYTGGLLPGDTGTIKVQMYCAAGGSTSTVSVSGTPGLTTAAAVPVATPSPIGTLTLVASPASLETCDGSIFLSATVRDTANKLVPDGTNVVFIATKGILDPASQNTTLGTANVVYTSDLKAPGSIKLSAQAGEAFASVTVPVTCGAGGSLSGSATSGALGAPGSPSFSPPRTGEGTGTSIVIRPPSTGDAGLKAIADGEVAS